ncbi:MAG TPA: chorismate mutase [Gaiellaceae bacterium]|jgi:chorismate mutase/prephenate dehydratase
MTDPALAQLRQQISEIDRSIIDAFNRRLELVAQIKRHKDEHGIEFVDSDREAAMLAHQTNENRGPLTAEGLRALYAELLALTKREVG